MPASITIDLFGFSRGAALARHFVNVILAGIPDTSRKPVPSPVNPFRSVRWSPLGAETGK
jgi:hypothetical protein